MAETRQLVLRFDADVYVVVCCSGQQSQGASSAATGGSQTSSSSSPSSSLPSNLSYTSYILKQTPQVGRKAFTQALLRVMHIHVQGENVSAIYFKPQC